MPIIFEGAPPYAPLFAKSASSKPTLDGVELTVNVVLDASSDDALPIRILLEPKDIAALASTLHVMSFAQPLA